MSRGRTLAGGVGVGGGGGDGSVLDCRGAITDIDGEEDDEQDGAADGCNYGSE